MELLLNEINRKKKEKDDIKKLINNNNTKFIKQSDLIKAQEIEILNNQRKYEEERLNKHKMMKLNHEYKNNKQDDGVSNVEGIINEENINTDVNKSINLNQVVIDNQPNNYKSDDISTINNESNHQKSISTEKSKKDTNEVNSDNESIHKHSKSYPTDPFGNILYSQINPPLTNEILVYKYFKSLLKRWENDLDSRSNIDKISAKGKFELKTHQQCKDHIKPLLKMCKRNQLDTDCIDILYHLVEMVKLSESGNFKAAHDEYIRTAIGNAAWPIGLTMVGIHERSGRERISTSKVAHVMNNESQRKYLTSVKRLLTYAQTKRPDIPPSMKVL